MAIVRKNRPSRKRRKTSRLRAQKKLRVLRRRSASPHGKRGGKVR